MELEQIMEMAKDPETRVAIVKMVEELRGEFYPMIEMLQETVGKDADKLVDAILGYSASKARYLYLKFIEEGFDESQALALVINSRVEIAKSIRSAR